jgi:myxalamid-type polyketide synthase MxaB
MALAAGKALLSSPTIVLENVRISRALTLGEESAIVQTIVRDLEGEMSFEIYSGGPDGEEWIRHCSGTIAGFPAPSGERLNVEAELSRLDRVIPVEIFYDRCRERGLDYGESFRGVREIRIGDGEALAKIVFSENITDELPLYQLHPRLLDACFQALLATVPDGGTLVPVAVERLTLYRPPAPVLWSHARRRPPSGDSIETDLNIFDEGGNPVARVEGLTSKRIAGASGDGRDLLYTVEWIERSPALYTEILETPGHWILFADGDEIAEGLAGKLRANGQTCTIARPGENRALEKSGENLKGVLYLSGLNPSADLETTIERECTNFLAIVQALIRRNDSRPSLPSPRLWLVTRGAIDIGNDSPEISAIAGAAPWGMMGAIAREHPEFRPACVDLDPRGSSRDAADALWSEIRSSGEEDRVVLRQGIRHVPRLTRTTLDDQWFDRLTVTEGGTIENLQWRSSPRRQPNFGEVEIEIRATGLNFRDLLNVLGMYPGEAGELGLECAGEVVRVGAGVTGLKIGDRVMGLVEGGFARYVTVPAPRVVPMVEGWTFEEAATVPGAFLTASRTLSEVAKLQPGERVLIHAAAGGVGLATIQLARQIGAEVFATASPGKWPFLRSLGIDRIWNSRTLDFAGEIDRETGGRGVDVVLNCLSGEFITESMAIVAPGGRFVEIGKQGILTAKEVTRIRPDIEYFTFDLLEIARSRPEAIGSSLGELRARFHKGELQPLPRRVFPIAEVKTAFRSLQKARDPGKIVVSRSGSGSLALGEGSYLIAGGFGALGSLVAKWLGEKGARHLILVGRGEPSAGALETIRELREGGGTILSVRADISLRAEVERVLATLEKENFPPLRGIVHAAGVLEDRTTRREDNEGFRRVIAPKVFGAWHLHQLTKEMPIDFFLLFSSFAGLSGSAGQVSYCAANAFLDALASARRGAGLPATSINWGAWGRSGMAARQSGRRGIPGMEEIDPIEGLKALEQILAARVSQVAVARLNWSDPDFLASPFFERVTGTIDPSPRPDRPKTLPPRFGKDHLLAVVLDAVARVLGLANADAVPVHRGFTELGLDSLTSIELRNQLQTTLNLSLPSTIAFDYPDVDRLVDYLAGRLFPSIVGEELPAKNGAREIIEDLSDAEAEALLLDELNRLPL